MAGTEKIDGTADTSPGEALRNRLLDAMLPNVAFDGWSDRALKDAAAALDVDEANLRIAFPRGAIDALVLFSHRADDEAARRIAETDLKPMKVRERIAFSVRTRIEVMASHREAARRGAAVFALPQHAIDGAGCVYRTCDMIWRAVGDTSTDFNFYTKRGLLSGVLTSTMLFWFGDSSEGAAETWKFLDNRIADVMQIEKVKSAVVQMAGSLPNPLTLLGALRYPGGR